VSKKNLRIPENLCYARRHGTDQVAAKKQTERQAAITSPVTLAWLSTQFDQVDIANATILNRIEDVKNNAR
jgi:hypothetical protein